MLTVTFSFEERDITVDDIPGTIQEFIENVNHLFNHHHGYLIINREKSKKLINLHQVQSIELEQFND